MTKYSKFNRSTRTLHECSTVGTTKGVVNPPVYHASTILFKTLDEIENLYTTPLPSGQSTYGIHGTTIHYALAQTINQLENAHDTLITPSGLSAITIALGAILSAGDHLLMSDSVYGPTRAYCDHVLSRQNVEVTYYPPNIGAEIKSWLKPNTRAIYLESPGSYTFEIQDTPAIAKVAKENGVLTLIDNTWATPIFHQPLNLGVDISIHATTKYFSGHSDVMGGSISANAAIYPDIHRYAQLIGNHIGPDDCYLLLRGLRTLEPRLKQHQENALIMANWLTEQAEVKQVIHPALQSHPDHQLWQRDFSGATGLFAFVLHPLERAQLAAFLDHMELFGMGFSWGGYESLLVPGELKSIRTASPWQEPGQLIRIHIGLEDIDDLKADLKNGFERINQLRG